MEVSIDGSTGQVTVRSVDDDGKEKLVTERLDLPRNVANGLVLTLLKSIRFDAPQMTVSMVAATPKPRLVKLRSLAKVRSRSRSLAPAARPRIMS
jgi:hypothetical protein